MAGADEDLFEDPGLRVGPVEDRDVGRLHPVGVGQPVDLVGDELGLVVLVVGDVHRDLLALALVGPEVLRHPALVAADHRVRRGQDVLGGAVVLLEQDRLGAGEVLLEGEDVADRRTAERVDRLVGVADHHQLGRRRGRAVVVRVVLAAELADQRVLRVVGVLVLVDEHVAEAAAVVLTDFGEGLQQVDRGHQQVVEVQRVRLGQPLLVDPVALGVRLLEVVRGLRRGRLVVDQLVLLGADPVQHGARVVPLHVQVELAADQRHQPARVGVVVDRERRADPEPLDVATQDPDAGRVEGGDPHQLRPRTDQLHHALAHLGGGLVGEGDREDRSRGARRGPPAGRRSAGSAPGSCRIPHRPPPAAACRRARRRPVAAD